MNTGIMMLVAKGTILSLFERARSHLCRKAKRKGQKRRCRILLLSWGMAPLCSLCMAAAPSVNQQQTAATDAAFKTVLWRRPENDGINCLFLQLRLLGYGASYQEFYAQASNIGGAQTLGSLAMLASRCGFHLVPVKLTAAELAVVHGPVILYMEGEGIGSGSFALWQSGDERLVEMVDGPSVRWIQLPRDSFRRAWTGYALVPERVVDWSGPLRRGATVLLIGYVGLVLWNDYRVIPRRSPRLSLPKPHCEGPGTGNQKKTASPIEPR